MISGMVSGRILGALVFAATLVGASLSTAAQDWQAGAGAEWQNMLAAAKKEGKVVLVGPPTIGPPMSEGFKRDTGIDVEFLGIVGATLFQRMSREYKAGNVTLDVVFSGAVTMPLQEYMTPLRPKLILPGVTDPKNWIDGKLKFADNADTFIFYPAEAVFGWPLINTDLVKPGTIKTWNDLLKPEFKGKIVIYDPRVPGPGVATSAFIADALGLDFVKKLYVDQQPKFARNGRQITEWVARGIHPLAVGISASDIEDFKRAGIKTLDVVANIEGTAMPIIGNFYPHVPAKAPHPNAAAVFMNWYGSKPGQEANSRAQILASRRTDVDTSTIPSYIRPKPGVKYIDQYAEDFVVNRRDKLIAEVRKIVGDDK
jgi:ABC-type Fe3+ transport system substrate-binding protein